MNTINVRHKYASSTMSQHFGAETKKLHEVGQKKLTEKPPLVNFEVHIASLSFNWLNITEASSTETLMALSTIFCGQSPPLVYNSNKPL